MVVSEDFWTRRLNRDPAVLGQPLVVDGSPRSIVGVLPGNLMADAILAEKNPVRALFVVAGNPLLSIGGEERMRAALEKLELLVVVDLYQNATGEYADYLSKVKVVYE